MLQLEGARCRSPYLECMRRALNSLQVVFRRSTSRNMHLQIMQVMPMPQNDFGEGLKEGREKLLVNCVGGLKSNSLFAEVAQNV